MMFHLLKHQKFGQVYQITDDMEEEGGRMKKLEDQLLNITIAVILEVAAFVDTDVQCLQQFFHQFYMFRHTEDSTCHNLCHMKIWGWQTLESVTVLIVIVSEQLCVVDHVAALFGQEQGGPYCGGPPMDPQKLDKWMKANRLAWFNMVIRG